MIISHMPSPPSPMVKPSIRHDAGEQPEMQAEGYATSERWGCMAIPFLVIWPGRELLERRTSSEIRIQFHLDSLYEESEKGAHSAPRRVRTCPINPADSPCVCPA